MFHVAYVSAAVTNFTKPQLRALPERGRGKNHRLEIAGLLLFRGGNFLQVLEGDEAKVRVPYQTVCLEPQHEDIFTLFEEGIRAREFPDWSMAFQDLDVEDCAAIPGDSDFLNSSWIRGDSSTDGGKARGLLAGLKERRR